MNIIIVGAGDIGIHLATIFSQEHHGIVLIDVDSQKLDAAARELDIATRLGSGTDWILLEELSELNPDLILALTDDDETNLIACTIAKNLGYRRTVARIREERYLHCSRLNIEQIFCVDYLIGPEKLTAQAIANMILIPGSVQTESFSNASVTMRTVIIPQNWRKFEKKIAELQLPPQIMIGLIKREAAGGKSKLKNLIFPHGDDRILPLDEVTFIGETKAIDELNRFVGLPSQGSKSLVIIGGSLIGINLAKILEHHARIKIIEKDYRKCCILTQKLPHCTILHHSGTDLRFLQSEKIGPDDVVVACTRNDEVNLLAGTLGKELGCENVFISLSDTSYSPIVKRLGIYQAASPRIQAANRILSIAREKTIASMVSMYENRAEVMEVKVSMDSNIAGIPIRELGPELPKDFLIVVIQSRGRVMIANGNRILTPGDTVIVISSPKHVEEIRNLF